MVTCISPYSDRVEGVMCRARLTRPGGHLFHEAVGEALQMLHLKLKVKAVGIEGMAMMHDSQF